MPLPVHRHRGIYAVVRDGDRVLTVRKSRGPYVGLLDLPGGSPHPNETWEETLRRELREEAGAELLECGDWHEHHTTVIYDLNGLSTKFEHEIVWCLAIIEIGEVVQAKEDVVNVEWLDITEIDSRTDLSRSLREVLATIV